MSNKTNLNALNNERSKKYYDNTITYGLYASRLRELAMARFKWENLPEEIDERYMEMSLNEYGMTAFFYDEIAERFVCLPMMVESQWDVYMNPRYVVAYSINGYHVPLGAPEYPKFTPIYNNMLREPTWPWLDYYAQQLYDIDMTRMVNVKAQKTPILLKGTDKQRLTLKNIWLQYDGNQPVIVVDNSLDGKEFNVLKTDAPFLGEQLTTMRRHVMGEAMIYLGYQTQDATAKRERVLSGEIETAQSESASSRFSPLIARRIACDKINKMFNLNISVNFRQDNSTYFELDNPMEQFVAKDPDNIVKTEEATV